MLKLNTFHLKIIAVISMLIDHIAYALIPSSTPIHHIMRILGRIAAPLFWFCFTEGYRHTSNKVKYAGRLGIAAGIMAIGNVIVGRALGFQSILSPIFPNIFLTMLLMLIAVECFERMKNGGRWNRLGCALIGIGSCVIAGKYAEYGWIAVGSILCFYFGGKWKLLAFALFSLVICCAENNSTQTFMILAALPISMYVSEKPRKSMKWFFYVFYPTHFWILMGVARWMLMSRR